MEKVTAYHGTHHAKNDFAFDCPHFFCEDYDLAETYGENVIEAELAMENTLTVWCDRTRYDEVEHNGAIGTDDIAKAAKEAGYDSIIFRQVGDCGPLGRQDMVTDVIAVFSASQIEQA